MKQFVQSIWWWTRVAIIVVVGTYALLSLWNNTGKPVTVWYWFGRTEDASVVALAAASFLAGGVICTTALALLTATWRYRRTRADRRERLIEERREEMARKAARLRVKPPPAPIIKRPLPPPPPPENVPIVVEVRQPPAAKIERQMASLLGEELEPPHDAIHVETHRATPFASTPAIDPRAKPPAGPEIVDEPRT
jgi:hypothetical protein